MKSFRRFTSIFLSVALLLGLVVVPTAAKEEISDEMITREYSLFDLSGVAVGSSTTGDDSVLPAGVEEAGIERNNQTKDFTGVSYHSGTQEVVEFQGQKMLKVVFDQASAQGNEDINNAKGVYSIKMNVPAGLNNYVKDISVEFAQHDKLGGNLRYRMGVIGDDKYGTQTYNVGYYGGGVVKMSISNFMTFSTFYKASDKWSWTTGNKSLGKWESPVEEVFLLFSSEAAKQDGGTGYCLLKEVKVTVTAPQSVYDNLPITGKVNLLDMSHAKVGPITTADYPTGVAEYEFDANLPMLPNAEGVRNVALNSHGKKVFRLDLSKVPFERTKDDKNYIGNTAGYKPLYYIKLTDIPDKHIPYIEDIAIKMRKSSNTTKVVYEFGVTNGSALSRQSLDSNFAIAPSNTSRVVHEINPKKLKKVQNKWRVTGYHQGGWDSWNYWDDDYTGLFLILSAYNADATAYGTLDIEEISYTYAAPKSEQKYFPATKKINLLDMYNAPLGEITNSQYPSGVEETNFHNSDTFTNAGGIKRVVKNDSGSKVLQLDLSSVTFEKKKDENYIGNTAQYNPVYYIKLANVPTGYIPYIENIGIKMKKSSATTKVIYELGVSDGTSYSRATRNRNMVIGASDTTSHAYGVNITNLKKVPKIWNVSDYIDETEWASYECWDNSYTTIFLALVADNAADRANAGTLDIEEISCTLVATGTLLDELNAELQENKKLVNDFENELGIETEFAVGGDKAFSGEGKRIRVPVSHPDLETAKGISFWVYNSGSSNAYPYYGVRLSTGVRYLDGSTSIPAGGYRYIEIDFSCVGIELSQHRNDGSFESMMGADVSLTAAQRANVAHIEITCSSSMSLLVDNIYLITDENHATRETSDIKINSNTVTGTKVVDGNVVNSGVSVKNGKIFIPASAQDQTVAISVPEGTLTNATQLIYNFTSNASAARLRFYTNAVFDSGRGSYSGKDAFIRFGTDPWRNNHKVNAKSTYRHEVDFYANSGNHNTCVSIIWADDQDEFKWPGTTCV